MEEASTLAGSFRKKLIKHYLPGFGIMPSGERNENFFGQLWARDFAHAAGNYFSNAHPEAVHDSLETLFKHQRADGALPYKVEREYALLRIIPGLAWLARPLFLLLEGKKKERALYEGEDTNGAEDTIPAIVIAAGSFLVTEYGKVHASRYFIPLRNAMEFFKTKLDTDGLVIVKKGNPDWTESVQRTGKLGFINVLWVESLFVMKRLAEALGETALAREYELQHAKSEKRLMEELYDQKLGYVRTKSEEDRVDTAASILAGLFFLDAERARVLESAISARARTKNGFQNFAPQYEARDIHLINRFFGTAGYHNVFVWPWVTCENIRLLAKIASHHPDAEIRATYAEQAQNELSRVSTLFTAVGGAYEVLLPEKPAPARSLFYRPPRNFLATMTAFLGAYADVTKA